MAGTRSVQILGTGQLLTLSRRLRAAGGSQLQQNMARRMRRAAEPLQKDLQQAIRTVQLPGTGRRVPGGPSPTPRPLRATLAAGIRTSIVQGSSPGARVWMDVSRLPIDLRSMPSAIDSGRVRHPVFGNRHKWATQNARPTSWWAETVRKGTPAMRDEVTRILDDIKDSLQ